MPVVNHSSDSPTDNVSSDFDLLQSIIIICLSCFCFVTVLGNGLVLYAVIQERYLKSATYYYMASLACADLFVGLIVMPFAIVQVIYVDFWPFGKMCCDLWHSIDVFASTASILDLCVIALDRYSAITNPISYHRAFFVKRWPYLLAIVWLCSGLISFPAIAYWRLMTGDANSDLCLFPDDIFYILLSSLISFYIPLIVMIFVYVRIYRAAISQLKAFRTGVKLTTAKRMKLPKNQPIENATLKISSEVCLRVHRGKYHGLQLDHESSLTDNSVSHHSGSNDYISGYNQHKKASSHERKRQTIGKRLTKFSKEQKATITLAYVMGIFVICWLPFFVYNPLTAIAKLFFHAKTSPSRLEEFLIGNEVVFHLVTWFGYMNSSVNPIIYAYSSREFRRAFVKYFCRCFPTRFRRLLISSHQLDMFSSRQRPSSMISAENLASNSDNNNRRAASLPNNSTATAIFVKFQRKCGKKFAANPKQKPKQITTIADTKKNPSSLVDYCTYHKMTVSRVTCV